MDYEDEFSTGGYSPYATPVAVAVPEAVLTIQQMGLPPEIAGKAVEIFYRLEGDVAKQVHPVKSLRTKRKARRVFLCIFMAYNEFGQPMDPVAIANYCRLDHDEIEQAFNDSSINIVIDPIKLSRTYVHSLNSLMVDNQLNVDVVESEVQHILQVCKRSKMGQELIDNSPAKHIAVGTICFYVIEKVQLNIPRNILERSCFLSWACINKYYRQIAQVYNSS